MHDLDRTLDASESEWEQAGPSADDFEPEFEFEAEFEGEGEFEDDDSDAEYEYEYADEYEAMGDYDTEGVFDESEEMELAAELLTVSSDEELEQFLGKLIKRAGRKIRRFAKSSTGRALRRGLKRIAKKALPIAGRVAGTAIGGPLGGRVGGAVAKGAGRFFGLELEGLSPEDQEFEVAKRVVRFAGEAAKNAARTPKSAPPTAAAKVAVKAAARKHAPGLLAGARPPAAARTAGRQRSGRWIRRGRRIVLMGV